MTVANGEVTREVPVMPGGQRFLGHAREFGRDPLALFQRAREHGDVVRIRFGPFCFYVLNSPSAIRQALVGEARTLGKGLNFGRAKRLIGNGLLMSEGENHHRQRRLMQPAFHRAEIARHVATMREVAVPRISAWPDGGTLALDREMRSITLTVLTRTLLSRTSARMRSTKSSGCCGCCSPSSWPEGSPRTFRGSRGCRPGPTGGSARPTGACAPC